MSTFLVHTDSGHGWIAVKRSLLGALGILGRISRFSYQRGRTVYLEEDCDALAFIAAYERTFHRKPALADVRQDKPWVDRSPIRGYQSFTLTEEESRQEARRFLREQWSS